LRIILKKLLGLDAADLSVLLSRPMFYCVCSYLTVRQMFCIELLITEVNYCYCCYLLACLSLATLCHNFAVNADYTN